MQAYWQKRWFRIFTGAAVAVLALIVGTVIAAAVKYHSLGEAAGTVTVLEGPKNLPDGKIPLGAKYLCRTIFKAPWNMTPGNLNVTPGEGVQLVAEPVFQHWNYNWGSTEWALDVELQPFRTGESGKGTIQLNFNASNGSESELFELTIPGVDATAPEAPEGGELLLAEKMPPAPKAGPLFWIGGGVIGLILILTVVLVLLDVFRRRKSFAPGKTVWDRALEAIAALKTQVMKAVLSPEHGVAELTDIIRNYLEQRFALRAERQTTVEFLRELDRESSPLEEQDRKFLRRFLEAADMVKFARLPADQTLFEDAALRAEKLVNGTRPDVDKEVRHA